MTDPGWKLRYRRRNGIITLTVGIALVIAALALPAPGWVTYTAVLWGMVAGYGAAEILTVTRTLREHPNT